MNLGRILLLCLCGSPFVYGTADKLGLLQPQPASASVARQASLAPVNNPVAQQVLSPEDTAEVASFKADLVAANESCADSPAARNGHGSRIVERYHPKDHPAAVSHTIRCGSVDQPVEASNS